jgi:winged helix DNA-binding protein
MPTSNGSKLRAWWSHRQGLDASLKNKSAREILHSTGWARSLGGVGPYLTIFARNGESRETTDEAVSKLEIHELPSARGCTYVVPREDFALALNASRAFSSTELKTVAKLGVAEREIDKLCDTVARALSSAALEPDELRKVLGGAVRNLGEEGKKKGVTTTLPVALGLLQSKGVIRRIATNGRFDQQRYRYALWSPNPLSKGQMSDEEIALELARRFFRWIGPATLAEFRSFSALSAKLCSAAIDSLGLVKIDSDEERWMFPEDRDAFQSFAEPKESNYVLVSGLDGITHLRRNVSGLLEDADLKKQVFIEKGYKEVGTLTDLPSHGIFDRGRLVGLWEFDMESKSIAWTSFVKKNNALEQAVKKTQDYVNSQLGDARSFSLDSPKSRASRIKALREQPLA